MRISGANNGDYWIRAATLGIHKYIKKISLLGSIHKTGETRAHTQRNKYVGNVIKAKEGELGHFGWSIPYSSRHH